MKTITLCKPVTRQLTKTNGLRVELVSTEGDNAMLIIKSVKGHITVKSGTVTEMNSEFSRFEESADVSNYIHWNN